MHVASVQVTHCSDSPGNLQEQNNTHLFNTSIILSNHRPTIDLSYFTPASHHHSCIFLRTSLVVVQLSTVCCVTCEEKSPGNAESQDQLHLGSAGEWQDGQ